uniref:Uncharacterized protein n=1 Tax=Cacopsylla melanoneura TaxID=428564 RepID=A0A8D8YU38_9HEMI
MRVLVIQIVEIVSLKVVIIIMSMKMTIKYFSQMRAVIMYNLVITNAIEEDEKAVQDLIETIHIELTIQIIFHVGVFKLPDKVIIAATTPVILDSVFATLELLVNLVTSKKSSIVSKSIRDRPIRRRKVSIQSHIAYSMRRIPAIRMRVLFLTSIILNVNKDMIEEPILIVATLSMIAIL